MRKAHLLITTALVLAFGALSIASASATLWLRNGVSVSQTIADSHGLWELHNTKIPGIFGGGEITIHCTGLTHGTVGTGGNGAADEITEFLA
jgi:hypothetical protein